MIEHIVLVEPNYYTKFPPLGLLKLSTLEKEKGNTTELVRKGKLPRKKPDKIYVTSLFTWAWRSVRKAIHNYKTWYPQVETHLGGLYASMLPEHAEKYSGADHVHQGLYKEAENLLPDYSLVPDWDGSIVFASRGCNNNCLYCVVPRLEGKICLEKTSIKHLIWPGHTRLIFFDNNILAMKYWRDIFNEILTLNMEIDFNQGLDARLMTEEAATYISKMKIPSVRLAYDKANERDYVERAIKILYDKGVNKRKILVYSLFNFTESPNEYLDRILDILKWGATCYPMRYQPPYSLKKDAYVSPKWTKEKLNMVAVARRVIGYGGAFPPYKGLIKKFNKAKDFVEAFELFPEKKKFEKEINKKLKQIKF